MIVHINEIEKYLMELPGITNMQRYAKGKEYFERFLKFDINNKTYIIEWYRNICYLYIDDFVMNFYKITANGNYPNGYKLSINFKGCDEDTIAVIPLEEY